ncbi:MAG: urate hydroxylase PuuD [Gemmatimonadetes bacterium]|nr:urate hydroxylase PuuD [Gemmatimonadota bacterium]
MSVFSGTEGYLFLLRWGHFLAGVTWIGLLYYFNLVQVPFFAETDAATKSNATQKLVPRALWWFRWGAMLTFLTGAAMLLVRGAQGGADVWRSAWGVWILSGAGLGTLMFLNVWLVIWPNQKIVIASAAAAAGGGQADPRAAGAGRRAFLASRTNAMFSVPMLFFMGAATHLPLALTASKWTFAVVATLVVLLLEGNALAGSTGPSKKPLETVSSVIGSGFVLTAVLYVLAVALL